MEPFFVFSAFFAGLLSFFAPCTLPIIPAFLSFISGVGQSELNSPELRSLAQRKIFLNGLFFVLGFSLVFILLGILVGLIGQSFGESFLYYKVLLTRIGGVIVILFGIFMLGLFSHLKIFSFLFKSYRIAIPGWIKLGNPFSSFLIGGTFSLGWTPCIGPILGTIILLAGTSGQVLEGALLLLVFSIGLALPFIILSLSFSKASLFLEKFSAYGKIILIVGGIFLIFIGLLLVTDNFSLTIQYGYRWFDFLHYDKLLNYL